MEQPEGGQMRREEAWDRRAPPLVEDATISRFLSETRDESLAAPLFVAGFAQRSGDRWEYFGGTTDQNRLNTPFDLASVTKPVFALLVSELVREGALTWDTPLEQVLPEAQGTWGGAQTIEALLSHRSGLLPHLELFLPSWSGAPISLPELLLRAATAKQPRPTTSAVYCDLGYILTGFAVEALVGQPLDHLLERKVLGPLRLQMGSSRSFLAHSLDFAAAVAETENQPPRGGVLRGVVHDDNAWALAGTGTCGHAGLFGTLGALLKFGAHTLDCVKRRLGSENEAAFVPLVQPRPGGTLRMGFDGVSGPLSMAGSQASAGTFGHLGFTGTSIWCDPTRDRVTVLLTNRVFPTRENPRIKLVRPKIHDFLWLS